LETWSNPTTYQTPIFGPILRFYQPRCFHHIKNAVPHPNKMACPSISPLLLEYLV